MAAKAAVSKKDQKTAISLVIAAVLIYLALKFGPALLKALGGGGSSSSARYSNASNPYGSATPSQLPRRSPFSFGSGGGPTPKVPQTPNSFGKKSPFGQFLYNLTRDQMFEADPSLFRVNSQTGVDNSALDAYQFPYESMQTLNDLPEVPFMPDSTGSGSFGGFQDYIDPTTDPITQAFATLWNDLPIDMGPGPNPYVSDPGSGSLSDADYNELIGLVGPDAGFDFGGGGDYGGLTSYGGDFGGGGDYGGDGSGEFID